MDRSIIHIAVALCVVFAAVTVLKPVVRRLLLLTLGVKQTPNSPLPWQDRVELRYEKLEPFVWMFAYFKLRLDPMFRELPELLKDKQNIRTALDLGCGYGVAGCAMLEWFGELQLYGIDPNIQRVKIASEAFGSRGQVFEAAAPEFELPGIPKRLDLIFILDVIHFLNDADLELTLRRIRARLGQGGHLILRVPMAPRGFGSFYLYFAKLSQWITGTYACYRSLEKIRDAITSAGFEISYNQMSGGRPELFWFIAAASAEKGNAKPDSSQQALVT